MPGIFRNSDSMDMRLVRVSMRFLLISIILVMVSALGWFLWSNKGLPPSITAEFIVPQLVSDEAWRKSIRDDPSAHDYSGYQILQERKSDLAIEEGLRDLKSDDPYVWLNAAHYLGSRGRPEAIAYLIKGLQHPASSSYEVSISLLCRLTGKDFVSFQDWENWYELNHGKAEGGADRGHR